MNARIENAELFHTRTVMDAGCECAPCVRSANPSDSWALVLVDATTLDVNYTSTSSWRRNAAI